MYDMQGDMTKADRKRDSGARRNATRGKCKLEALERMVQNIKRDGNVPEDILLCFFLSLACVSRVNLSLYDILKLLVQQNGKKIW